MEFLRRRLGLIARCVVSLLAVAYVIHTYDWVKVWGNVQTMNFWWLLAGLVCFIPTLLVVSWRWRMLLGVHGVHMRFWRVFELTMIGQFFSAFLLGTTGGDVIKIYYVARAVPDRKTAVGFTVIVDRVIGMIALLLFGIALTITQLPLLFSQHATKVCTLLFYLIAFGGIAGSVLACFGPALLQHPAIRSLAQRLPLAHHGTKLLAAYERTARAFGINVIALIGSLPSHICMTLMGYCVMNALGMSVPLLVFCAIVVIVNLLIALPISISGIGWREWLFISFFGLVHIDQDHATAFSLTYFVLTVVWSMAGGPFYFLYRHETHAPPPDPARVEPLFSES